jgi:hypothetical protein
MQARYAGCLLAALLLSAYGSGKNDTTSTGPQTLDVTARDFALKINGSSALRPGPVKITARNTGKQLHGMVLVKLNDGVNDATLVDALKSHPDQVPNLLTYVGGTTRLPTAGTWSVTTSFDPGNYAMLDVGTSTQGRYNFTRAGEVQGFTVSGKQLKTPQARPSATVALYDYGIDMPKVIPQSGSIKVQNTGDDDHQLAFIPIKNAKQGAAILRAFKTGKPTGENIAPPIEVLAPTSSATSSTVHYKLPKGAYIAYCSYRSAASGGRLHASLGMVAAFAVQ